MRTRIADAGIADIDTNGVDLGYDDIHVDFALGAAQALRHSSGLRGATPLGAGVLEWRLVRFGVNGSRRFFSGGRFISKDVGWRDVEHKPPSLSWSGEGTGEGGGAGYMGMAQLFATLPIGKTIEVANP